MKQLTVRVCACSRVHQLLNEGVAVIYDGPGLIEKQRVEVEETKC